MLVVSDATPINVLVRIGYVEVLPQLFQKVVLPTAVAFELTRPATPAVVSRWLASKPPWLEIRAASSPDDPPAHPRHRGEREAIRLAQELRADLLLVDEPRPRRIAVQLGIAVIGTVGILERAAAQSLLDLKVAFTKLRETDFYVSQTLLDEALKRQT